VFIAMEFVVRSEPASVLQEAPRGLRVERALTLPVAWAPDWQRPTPGGPSTRQIKRRMSCWVRCPTAASNPSLDFGIAAMAEGITNMSHTHGLLLTPEYASPEQWRGTPAAELDGRTRSLRPGRSALRDACRAPPLPCPEYGRLDVPTLAGSSAALERLRPALAKEHPGLEAIVMRLLAREREQRFPSAAAFLEATAPSSPRPKRPRPVP